MPEKINAGERTGTHRLTRDTLELDISNHQRSKALEQFLDGFRLQDQTILKVAHNLAACNSRG